MKRRPGNSAAQEGYSLIEILIVAAVMLVVSQAFAVFLATVSKGVRNDRAEAYAAGKAVQMLEELRALVIDDAAEITALDPYDDGYDTSAAKNPLYKYCLTTKRTVTHDAMGATLNDWSAGVAGNPISANPSRKGWAFVRHVRVIMDPKDPNIRKIYVRIFAAASNPGPSASSTPQAASDKPIAEVSGMVKSIGKGNNPVQVMDMYLVALESVPGWWSRTSNLIPLMQSAIVNVQARNPGLRIRSHWIKRMSYGRDPEYTPEINSTVEASSNGAFDKAYIYPGLVTYSNGQDYYYLPSWFKARVNIDGSIAQNDGYALADQFNHAVRQPDEDNLYEIHKIVAANSGAAAPDYSLRQLMQKMYDSDPALINSIVINLHGEMVPVVPLRNVSDAAKDPEYYATAAPGRGFRVVTHPRKLHYDSAADPLILDTYAYDATAAYAATAPSETQLIDSATLFIPNASTSDLESVERLQGSSSKPYHWYGWYAYQGTSWTARSVGGVAQTPWQATSGALHDGVLPQAGDSTWVADDYADTVNGRTGLRIRFFGVSATARAYAGPAWNALAP
jgi:type II secretory pathway pseudopilin PulG